MLRQFDLDEDFNYVLILLLSQGVPQDFLLVHADPSAVVLQEYHNWVAAVTASDRERQDVSSDR